MDEYLEALEEDMSGAITALERDLVAVRTGRATPKLVDGVMVLVQSYGATMGLNELATVKAPDARLLTITPWDKSTIPDIQKAIVSSGLGLNPSSDGQLIRVPVPALTQERRQELVRVVKAAGEDSKIRLRKIRKEYNDIFKNAESDGDISEDEMHGLLDRVQKTTDRFVKLVGVRVVAKEAEVLEV